MLLKITTDVRKQVVRESLLERISMSPGVRCIVINKYEWFFYPTDLFIVVSVTVTCDCSMSVLREIDVQIIVPVN